MAVTLKRGASKESMNQILELLKPTKGLNTKKYCGKIKLNESPLQIQKKLRDDWKI